VTGYYLRKANSDFEYEYLEDEELAALSALAYDARLMRKRLGRTAYLEECTRVKLREDNQ